MKNVLSLTLAALLAAAAVPLNGAPQAAPLADHVTANTVTVTVTYKGHGRCLPQTVGVAVRLAEHRRRFDADRPGRDRDERRRRGVR
jgi:hypothetical protein